MWPNGERVIQDPVHGLMRFRGPESLVVDLLSCKELQRLRRIRQMGMGSFVFPGAEHSRFAHSIGVAYVAAQMIRQVEAVSGDLPAPLRPDASTVRDFTVGALCHDLGHGPFSHVWEHVVIGDDWDRRTWGEALGVAADGLIVRSAKWHELVTHALLSWEDGQLHRRLESNERQSSLRVRELLTGNYYLGYLPRLLSGDIDADRCDFLLRDALMCGLPLGRFQLDRLIASLRFGRSDTDGCYVGLDAGKGLHAAAELLQSRINLYQVAYYHKTIKGMEWLLAQLLRRLKDLYLEGSLPVSGNPLITPLIDMLQGKPVSLDRLLGIDDFTVWVLVGQVPELSRNDVTAVQLATRLVEREPLRSIPIDSRRIHSFFHSRGREGYDEIEAIVSKYVSGEPRYYYRMQELSLDVLQPHEPAQTMVVDWRSKSGEIRPLCSVPAIRNNFADEISIGTRLFVVREAADEITKLLRGEAGYRRIPWASASTPATQPPQQSPSPEGTG